MSQIISLRLLNKGMSRHSFCIVVDNSYSSWISRIRIATPTRSIEIVWELFQDWSGRHKYSRSSLCGVQEIFLMFLLSGAWWSSQEIFWNDQVFLNVPFVCSLAIITVVFRIVVQEVFLSVPFICCFPIITVFFRILQEIFSNVPSATECAVSQSSWYHRRIVLAEFCNVPFAGSTAVVFQESSGSIPWGSLCMTLLGRTQWSGYHYSKADQNCSSDPCPGRRKKLTSSYLLCAFIFVVFRPGFIRRICPWTWWIPLLNVSGVWSSREVLSILSGSGHKIFEAFSQNWMA